jgi:hypothetical protein
MQASPPDAARGNWMQTHTGQRFYPLDPRPDEIHPADVARALSMTCRFGGHVRRFYSVAEHCVLMARTAMLTHPGDRFLALHMLLHDATEAYVGDMVRPLKRAIPHYEAIEHALWQVVMHRFDLYDEYRTRPLVKEYDNRILLDERDSICNPANELWGPEFATLQPLGVRVDGWAPVVAEENYLETLAELGVEV